MTKLIQRLKSFRARVAGKSNLLGGGEPSREVGKILERAAKGQADPDRWGDPASYGGDHWDDRARQAAQLVPDGLRVLEIGVGKGAFKALVKGRCTYTGADLNPLDRESLRLDLETDPLPYGPFDVIVLLGVLEYLHKLDRVTDMLRDAAPSLLISYCCVPGEAASTQVRNARLERGWVNHLTAAQVRTQFGRPPFLLSTEETFKTPGRLSDQRIFLFTRN